MANVYCIWPVGQSAARDTYMNTVNAHFAANYETGGVFTVARNDKHNQPVCAYWGPPYTWNGVVVIEPANVIPLRSGAVIAIPEWPSEDI